MTAATRRPAIDRPGNALVRTLNIDRIATEGLACQQIVDHGRGDDPCLVVLEFNEPHLPCRPHPEFASPRLTSQRPIRNQRWKYVWNPTDVDELRDQLHSGRTLALGATPTVVVP